MADSNQKREGPQEGAAAELLRSGQHPRWLVSILHKTIYVTRALDIGLAVGDSTPVTSPHACHRPEYVSVPPNPPGAPVLPLCRRAGCVLLGEENPWFPVKGSGLQSPVRCQGKGVGAAS